MDIDIAVTIKRPPEAVFRVLAEIHEYIRPGSPIPEMEKIPPGPTGVGTRWREVVRLLPGLTMTVWSTVTEILPARRLYETFRGPWMTGTLRYDEDRAAGGTVLRQRETLTPHGPLRIMAGTIDRMLRPRVTARLASIRDLLEAGAA